jgi:glycosyltransferase involved in cell wall biosynthesis
MTITFFTNFINHHQMPLSEELYRLTDGNYYLVETEPIYDWLKTGGYSDLSYKPYVIQAWKSDDEANKAAAVLKKSDVVLFNPNEGLKYGVAAAKMGKLCLEVSERWLKRGWINILSPRLLRNMWYYHTLFKYKSVYKLCSSAFGAADQYKLFSYKNKCYKWGYFTKVDDEFEVEKLKQEVSTSEITPLMWCARFLRLKHPELPIKMAARLKAKGYKFSLNMYGSGEEYDNSVTLAKELNVDDVVKFCGNVPNEQILEAMRHHEIFLFTSDKNEGWGAVANESMSNGCVLVGSDAIGSVPFLLKDGENGCIFKSCNLDSLTEKVEWLLNNPKERYRLAVNGYNTMKNIWSPANAAKSLLQLIEDLKNGKDSSVKEGPCSRT